MLEIHLGGHLSFYTPGKRSRFSLPIASPSSLAGIVEQLGVPLAEVTIAAVNGELVDIETAQVQPGDKIELYPPIGGG
ncbi:MAG TPA: MoaD/ThiS family protein [Anaerolineales bacterium]|nr:MoaD/ThiS family protein [Anaerolineales bacterium]